MADLFSVTVPLAMRRRDSGEKRVVVEAFPHPEGVLCFDLFWEQAADPAPYIHLERGELSGEGPWRCGEAVFTVLGCHGTDPELACLFADWRMQREMGALYPDDEAVKALAREHGAAV